MEKITLQTIADKIGVSKALVSKALTNDPRVNDITKELIWKTAEELGYRIKSSKKTVPASKTGNIALLLPRSYLTDMEYWGKVIQGIESELSKNGFSIILSSLDITREQREVVPLSIFENKVDGAFVLGHLPESYINGLKVRGLPFVMVDANSQDPEVDHVLSNNFLGAYQAVKHLIHAGHYSLGFVGDVHSSWSFVERKRGFEKAINDYNTKSNQKCEAITIEGMGVSGEGNYILDSFETNLKRHILLDKSATALFCANDMIAIETMKILSSFGVQCPKDVSIVGFDDLALCEHIQPQLTTVFVPKVEIGCRAAQLLIRRINDRSVHPEFVQLSTFLIERASVRDLNQIKH